MFGMSSADDGRTVASVRQSLQQVPEVWAGPIGELRQISNSNAGLKVNVGKVESLHWTSDGAAVQGWLVYPHDFNSKQKYPMIVFFTVDQPPLHCSTGLYPNPRGSFGHGEQFTQGNVKNLGYGDLRDIEAGGVEYAIQTKTRWTGFDDKILSMYAPVENSPANGSSTYHPSWEAGCSSWKQGCSLQRSSSRG